MDDHYITVIFDGRNLSFNLNLNTTIGDFKLRIYNECGIPVQQQILSNYHVWMSGQTSEGLEDDRTIREAFTNNQRLQFILRLRDPSASWANFLVFIRPSDDPEIWFTEQFFFHKLQTVGDLKWRIAVRIQTNSEYKVRWKQVQLTFGGKVLDNKWNLFQCQVKNKSTVLRELNIY